MLRSLFLLLLLLLSATVCLAQPSPGVSPIAVKPIVAWERNYFYTGNLGTGFDSDPRGLGVDSSGNVYQLQTSATEFAQTANVRLIRTSPAGVSVGLYNTILTTEQPINQALLSVNAGGNSAVAFVLTQSGKPFVKLLTLDASGSLLHNASYNASDGQASLLAVSSKADGSASCVFAQSAQTTFLNLDSAGNGSAPAETLLRAVNAVDLNGKWLITGNSPGGTSSGWMVDDPTTGTRIASRQYPASLVSYWSFVPLAQTDGSFYIAGTSTTNSFGTTRYFLLQAFDANYIAKWCSGSGWGDATLITAAGPGSPIHVVTTQTGSAGSYVWSFDPSNGNRNWLHFATTQNPAWLVSDTDGLYYGYTSSDTFRVFLSRMDTTGAITWNVAFNGNVSDAVSAGSAADVGGTLWVQSQLSNLFNPGTVKMVDLRKYVNTSSLYSVFGPATATVGANGVVTASITGAAGASGMDVTLTSSDANLVFSNSSQSIVVHIAPSANSVNAIYVCSSPGSYTIKGVDGNGVIRSFAVTALTGSSTTLNTGPNPSTFGQQVTLSATVTPQGPGTTPTGSVTFFEGNAVLGAVSLTNGTAVLFVSNFSTGAHSLSATYSGDSNYGQSAGSATQTVN